jgi:hypothetical protein
MYLADLVKSSKSGKVAVMFAGAILTGFEVGFLWQQPAGLNYSSLIENRRRGRPLEGADL